ncbi:MAG: hypothetical protein K5906_02785 [Bacilli bacterium]|nr:hypothetical protein [Bacilli bacterium]
MFTKLKKSIITKAIAKRNKNNSFDYIKAEEFSLKGVNDPLINNSYYFSAHNLEMSIFLRLGERINKDETWFVIFYKGKVYSLIKEEYEAHKGPIKIYKKDGVYFINFKGLLNEDDEVNFEATFTNRSEPLNFSSDMPASRMALGMANEKWKKSFFSSLDKIQGQTHYEQEGTLKGCFTLNKEKVEFSLPCVRDHSFGPREWNYMNNHLWLMAINEELQFNYSLVSYPVMGLLEVGNYHLLGDKQQYMLYVDNDLNVINQGLIPTSLSLYMYLEDKKKIKVDVKVIASISYHFEEGNYILHENIAEYNIDGHISRGILEIGFNKDEKRYFNARKLESYLRK